LRKTIVAALELFVPVEHREWLSASPCNAIDPQRGEISRKFDAAARVSDRN
jgi:hypothetical protein